MKKVISIFFMALLMAACSSQEEEFDDINQPQEPQQTYTVSFGLGNFDANVETRAGSAKTIYGINVWYNKNKDNTYYHYAYGLFDNTNNMSITLIGGYKYKFACSIVRDADEELYYGPYSSNNFSGYAKPFQLNNSSSTALQNKFIISESTYLNGLENGVAVLKSSSASLGYATSGYYPSLERYYGELVGYEPVSNGKVIIPVKKTYFGNKVVIKGVSGGTVTASCYIGSNNSNNTVWSLSGIKTDYAAEGSIYSYYNVSDCWQNEGTLTGTVTFKYTSDRGSWWDLSGSKNIVFKRNVMTTITINLSPDFSGGSIGVTEEELGDDNEIILKGDNGTLEDVTVSPSE